MRVFGGAARWATRCWRSEYIDEYEEPQQLRMNKAEEPMPRKRRRRVPPDEPLFMRDPHAPHAHGFHCDLRDESYVVRFERLRRASAETRPKMFGLKVG